MPPFDRPKISNPLNPTWGGYQTQAPRPAMNAQGAASEYARQLLEAETAKRQTQEQQAKDHFQAIRESGEADIQDQYGAFRSALQSNMVGRGLGRSGFLGTEMARTRGAQGMAMADLENDMQSQWADYVQAGEQLDFQKSQQEAQKRAEKRQRKYATFGKALGAISIGAGLLTGNPMMIMGGVGAMR